MKKLAILSSLLLLALNSCSNEDIINEELTNSFEKRITVVAEDLTPAEGTRTSYTENGNGYSFAWSEGDALGIFPENGYQTAFPIGTDGVGSNTAVFDGGKWALRPNESYAAYYPLVDKLSLDSDAIPVDYTGQTQIGNNSTAHLSKYDFMASSFNDVDDKGNVNFQLQHLGCLVQFKLTMPEADTYSALEIESDNTPFITIGEYSLSDANHKLSHLQTSQKVTIGLSNIATTAEEKDLIITAMFAPVDLTDSNLTLIVKGSSKDYNFVVDGKNLQNGMAVDGTKDSTTPYVTFHAEAEQTLTMSMSVPTLEYSVNNGKWTELGTNTVTFGGNIGDLRLRGQNEYGTASSYKYYNPVLFGNSTKVYCSGDIRTLVDYKNYSKADTQRAGFCYLFYGAEQLVSPPSLNSTNLASYCYYQMFYGCTSLTKAPKLPAIELYKNCYESMFEGCTSLVDVPDLSCQYLANECCKKMFYGCTSLEKAPALPAKNLAYSCYDSMFASCSSLVTAPELPATMLADRCYYAMFSQCTSLTKAPDLLATSSTVGDMGYAFMFNGCSNLQYVKMMALIDEEDEKEYRSLGGWMHGVSPTGTFVKNINSAWNIIGSDGIPEGWNVIYCDENGHECVDLGTGVKWATCNIGAEKPEDFGLYFAWGETIGYGQDISDGHSFDWGTYDLCWGDENSLKKYNSSLSCGAYPDNKMTLEDIDDAANVNWGGNWHMPNEGHMQYLVDNCTWTWTTLNGVNGYMVSSKINNNSIFLPAAGDRVYSSFGSEPNTEGNYWTSKRDFGNNCGAIVLTFDNYNKRTTVFGKRCIGLSIRPIYREIE